MVVGEGNEAVVTAAIVPLQHLVAKKCPSRIKKGLDVFGQGKIVLVIFGFIVRAVPEERSGGKLAAVAGDNGLGSTSQAADRFPRGYLRSLIENDDVEEPKVWRNHFSCEDGGHGPAGPERGEDVGGAREKLPDAEVAAPFCGLSPDQCGLLRVVVHCLNDGFCGEAVDALGGRVPVLAVGLGEFVPMAGMGAAVERRDPLVFKLEIFKDAPQPGLFESAGSMLGCQISTNELDEVSDPGFAETGFKLTDTGKVRDRGAIGYHSIQHRGQIGIRQPVQVVDPHHVGQGSKP